MNPPTEITLPDKINGLVQYCETSCVAGCCGLFAYDFAPIHVSSYLATLNPDLSADVLSEWEAQVSELADAVMGISPNEKGYLCAIPAMNHWFRPEEFENLIAELKHSIRASAQLLALSKKLEYPVPAKCTHTEKSTLLR